MDSLEAELPIRIVRPPDYSTCGPTALHAVYRYYGDPIDRASVYRLLGAIFLGVGSDDGNLMRIKPKGWEKPRT
jgi:hypothetical protein